jgi:hypothetical protein
MFDCTVTGVTGHYRPSQVPFTDRTGREIQDQRTWIKSRNQQRNWETLLQLIGLRCLPEEITEPRHETNAWTFSFSVDTPAVLGSNDFDSLYRDCQGVPMIADPATGQASVIQTQGPERNIWFSAINI